MKEWERILITVKTYPTISRANTETVCTGGINEQGQWRRLHPVPFRYLDEPQQYRVFDIVEAKLGPGQDSRPESRRPDIPTLRVKGHLDEWDARCQWVNPTIEPSMSSMKEKGRTLAPVQVAEIVEFLAEKSAGDWTPKQKAMLQQELLFDPRKPLEKIPWDFRLRWKDGDGQEYNFLFISWEVCQTWRSYSRDYADPIKVMREKWMNDLLSKDRQVSLFIGNMARFQDNYLVCGTFTPPKLVAGQGSLFA